MHQFEMPVGGLVCVQELSGKGEELEAEIAELKRRKCKQDWDFLP